MAGCKHKELCITEQGTANTEHVRDGDSWSHNIEFGAYKCMLQATCLKCGLDVKYSRYSKNLPKYLQEALEELGI